MYRLIDTHAHLDEMEGIERVLAEAKEAGLVAIVAVKSGGRSPLSAWCGGFKGCGRG